MHVWWAESLILSGQSFLVPLQMSQKGLSYFDSKALPMEKEKSFFLQLHYFIVLH